MKPSLCFLFSSLALAFAMRSGGQVLGFAELTSILFSAGLAGWIIELYDRKVRVLRRSRPIHLPMAGNFPKRRLLGASSRKAA